MGDFVSTVGDGLWNAFLMAYEVWWALVLGFAISAIVQAWVPRERVERALAVREGRLGRHRARLPIRLHEPRLGAGARAVDPDRVAVHAR